MAATDVQCTRPLKSCAKLMRDTVSGEDLVVRIGGDEFAMIIASDEKTSLRLLDRPRAYVNGRNEQSWNLGDPLRDRPRSQHNGQY
jgi:GGDEF domain-containing protein